MSFKANQTVLTPFGYGTIIEPPIEGQSTHYKVKLANDVFAFIRVE